MADEYRTRLKLNLCPEWKLSTAMEPCMSQRRDWSSNVASTLQYKLWATKAPKRKRESWGSPKKVGQLSKIAQLSGDTAEAGHQAPWLPVQCSCLITRRTGPQLFALRWGGKEAVVSWEVMYCQGKDYRSNDREISWQGTMALWILSTASLSRALWKTGSAPNAECPLCLEFSTCNSISRTTDIITAPRALNGLTVLPKLMNKIVQNLKEMRIRENVPQPLWGWSSKTWSQTTLPCTSLLLPRMKEVRLKRGWKRHCRPSDCSSHYHRSQKTFHWGNKKSPGLWVWIPKLDYQLKVWP